MIPVHSKPYFVRWMQKNLLWIFFMMALMLISFFVGQAFADSPPERPRARITASENLRVYRGDFVSKTTTTTAPKPRRIEAPSSVVASAPNIPQGDWVTLCHSYATQAGIVLSDDAIVLIGRESKCDVNATNSSSGACSIPQALPCSKLGDARYDPVKALLWMEAYVNGRYGGWTGARQHSDRVGWY